MKRFRFLALCLAAILCLGLCGCDELGGVTTFDASAYVKGALDEAYLGVYDPVYLDLVNSTEAEAAKAHAANIDAEYARFAAVFEIDDSYLSDETIGRLKDLIAQVYSYARYTVGAATAMDGGEYAVKVTITPVTFFSEFYQDEYEDFAETFNDTYGRITQSRLNAMTETERETFWTEYEEDWATGLEELLNLQFKNVGYGDPVTFLVWVYPDENGRYTFSQSDYRRMDDLILEY